MDEGNDGNGHDMEQQHLVFLRLQYLSYGLCMSMCLSCVVLLRPGVLAAPYGRYTQHATFGWNWGADIPPQVAWSVQECPSMLVPLYYYYYFCDGNTTRTSVTNTNTVLLWYFIFHYFHRTIIYPCRIRHGKPTKVGVVVLAFCFTSINGYIQGRSLTLPPPSNTNEQNHTLQSPHFMIGSLLFWWGLYINWSSDTILRNLRTATATTTTTKDGNNINIGSTGSPSSATTTGDGRYQIPYGGWFVYVSCANYFGEILEWIGFAIACQGSIPATCFAINTILALVPRAYRHHHWYLTKFEQYQELKRTAIIPLIL